MTTAPALTAAEAAAVRALARAATSADGISPLNDDALFALAPTSGRASNPVTHLLAREDHGAIIGYGQLDFAHVCQLVVAPEHRRQGIGQALAASAQAMDPAARLWSFGHLSAAQGFAARNGLQPARE
ncbi:MAG: GNAT family N-acetyltransferase, partial [Propionibacteriaceae bacterium]|nr:GNAT family N-acetyltransferase [Propionibacteriaceae bacterium]